MVKAARGFFCPECGWNAGCDDEGLCLTCGATTTGNPVVLAAPDMLEALGELLRSTEGWTHAEICSRSDNCDEARRKGEKCMSHKKCPDCDCGLEHHRLARRIATLAIAKARGET